MHFIVNGFRLGGEEWWTKIMESFSSPGFKVGEYLVLAAFIFHALNGARLIFQELGFLLGRPRPPVYPYTDALRRKRPLVMAMMALIGILVLVVLLDFII